MKLISSGIIIDISNVITSVIKYILEILFFNSIAHALN